MPRFNLTKIEDTIIALARKYFRAGGNAQRLIALLQRQESAGDDAPATTTTPVPASASVHPFPLNSIFNVRIGTRVVGTVRVREYGNLADRAEGDMRLWAKLATYAKENKLSDMDVTHAVIPARVLNKFLRETSQRVIAS